MIQREWGWIVEEYPNDPALYTLNGWLTVIQMVAEWRGTLSEVGIEIDDFLRRNMLALRRLLPLYDIEELANSRYQLTGFTRLRLVFNEAVEKTVKEFSITIPGEGICEGSVLKGRSRWCSFLERDEDRICQFNIVQSLISFPQPNVFKAQIKVSQACHVKVMVGQGQYRPDMSGLPVSGWREIAKVSLGPDQPEIETPIFWDDTNLFAYPTNFKKRIGGKLYNAYHYIHVMRFAKLYAKTHEEIFREFSAKWLEYAESWPNLDQLHDPDIELGPHKYTMQELSRNNS